MTISELIEQLNAIMAVHGDVVVVCERDAGTGDPEPTVQPHVSADGDTEIGSTGVIL